MTQPGRVVETTDKADYLTFFIAGEEYGIPILRARESLELHALTRVPAAPACVRGVLNLRGAVVPVVDLAIQFGQRECAVTKLTCVGVDKQVVLRLELDSALSAEQLYRTQTQEQEGEGLAVDV